MSIKKTHTNVKINKKITVEEDYVEGIYLPLSELIDEEEIEESTFELIDLDTGEVEEVKTETIRYNRTIKNI